ncbi:hypothetical protein OG205_32180 [Lentzea sp. NBC_00516]|uniref:hypothetical protein n=1 Tax=Lentzea sp. NBC_00516 TaxID=2903582 RepID=UPI002E803519|nr:hypothetical protein [Lentzea sp. NBC_00516]WUD22710.1 hypothetical protein OG205_32180 [Lentzea sp. NBC_00516]
MNRSIVLVAIAAALGLSACTSTPTPAPDTTATSSSAPSSATPPTTVVTTVVTQTVTNPPPPPAKPVIGSFGYGGLKLGMTLQQAQDAKLIGPNISGEPDTFCTFHDIIGTGGRAYVSKAKGVSSIFFTADMSSDGIGSGATEEKLKVEYTNLKPSIGSSYTATADGNSNAYFHFLVGKGMVTTAVLNINGQDCHS